MRIIAVSTPAVSEQDPLIIRGLLKGKVDFVHLRKPDSNIDECREILKVLTPEERSRIIIHDFSELYFEFSLKGIHINKNVRELPDGYNGFRTRSCHSLEEIVEFKADYDYLFLSPVFDSISKEGYKSKFTHEELQRASSIGIIDEKVVALGGVTIDKIPYLEKLGFGGAAMIGGVYNMKLATL